MKIVNTNHSVPHAYRYSGANGEPIDPRQTPAFVQLDQLVTAFRASFPVHLRNPAREQVDPHLFSACAASHLYAKIYLVVLTLLIHCSAPTSSCTNHMQLWAKTPVTRLVEL